MSSHVDYIFLKVKVLPVVEVNFGMWSWHSEMPNLLSLPLRYRFCNDPYCVGGMDVCPQAGRMKLLGEFGKTHHLFDILYVFCGSVCWFKKKKHCPCNQISSCEIKTNNNLASSRIWWLSFGGMCTTGGPAPGQFLPGGVSYLIEGWGAGSFFCNLLLLSEKYYLRILITADW